MQSNSPRISQIDPNILNLPKDGQISQQGIDTNKNFEQGEQQCDTNSNRYSFDGNNPQGGVSTPHLAITPDRDISNDNLNFYEKNMTKTESPSGYLS